MDENDYIPEVLRSLPPLDAWYLVPYGADIPAGTPHLVAQDGRAYVLETAGVPYPIHVVSGQWWTPVPITPPLPTTPGTQILATIRGGEGTPTVLTRIKHGLPWKVAESVRLFTDAEIEYWCLRPAIALWWENTVVAEEDEDE